MEPLEREIAELIVSCTGLEDVRAEEIDPEAPLFGDGLGLDSIDALEIGVALAKRYGVKLTADSEDNRRHFASIRALARFVAAQRSADGLRTAA
ncbi:MAG: phosphopantetheine-binding protein [Burkholderiaceae bacterium]|nr:phosphopantetheine-binding protein [Burkholderiaceae bacterium]MCX7901926.1 phosphopantetheine-binding protein [Burkholderiaceae bacterium]